MIIMALILMLGIGLLGGMIISLPIALIAGPALIGVLSGSRQFAGGGLLISGLCLVAYLPVLILASGILTSFTESAWTLTFMRLVGGNKSTEPETVA
jgi:hypothetical protein